jgi:3-hydroxy-9,10-secoandrosta-1,3,5(10)-triene-9,17-dione monooxygenase reductase component
MLPQPCVPGVTGGVADGAAARATGAATVGQVSEPISDALPRLTGRAADGAVTPRMMKDVLRNFGTGVTVITATSPDGPIGFTCQTFASLSLDPPLVSFCPARTSTTWPRIRDIGQFTINILADDHSWLSDTFAQAGAAGTDKFDGVGYTLSTGGSPVLEGVLAWVDCRLRAEHDGGDHTIVVADVLDLDATPDVMPLFYFRGDYLGQRQG